MSARRERHAGEKLRRAAEARLKSGGSSQPTVPSRLPAELVHELQVHQIELELQNEELQRAQAEVEEARDRYLELYDFAPVGYVTLDAAGRITDVNLTGAALLGVDRADLRSRPFDRMVMPEDRPRWASHLEAVRDTEASQGCELVLRPARGAPFPAQLTSARAAASADRPASVRCTLVDITERRRSEQERERRVAELLGLNQRLESTQLQLLQADKLAAIGRLAAGVAHEINNPLSYALSNLFMVEEYVGEILEARRDGASGSSDPARRDLAKHDLIMVERDLLQSLAESRDGLERVSRVVKDLKAFAHPDTGHWEVVELHEVIEGALRIVAGALGESVRVSREYEEGALMLRCRPMQIGQVLMNVLVNASQAIAPSGTITVRTGRTGHEAWVEIEDNGAGISADHLSRLFDPFFTTKAMGVGTGLGLSIAHGIVKSHGGRVEVRSDLGAGSTFRIVLPLEKAEAAPAPLTGSRGCRPPPDEGSPSGDDTP